MRASLLKSSALAALLRLSSAQSQSETWAQTQPFDVDVSTESLLGSSQQPLTNVIAESTPGTTGVAPAVTVTGAFSTSIPTELVGGTSVVVVTSTGASASASESSASESAGSSSESVASLRSTSASASASSSRASSSGTGAAVQSTAAAAPGGVNGQHKMMGVAGALAGAAGVLFV